MRKEFSADADKDTIHVFRVCDTLPCLVKQSRALLGSNSVRDSQVRREECPQAWSPGDRGHFCTSTPILSPFFLPGHALKTPPPLWS